MDEVIYFGGNYDKYEGLIQFSNGIEPKHSVYSDRLLGWNYEKFNECCQKVWGDAGQAFYSDRKPKEVEKFLRFYTDDETLTLCRIIQYENMSNGYPYWRFDYITNKK